MRKADTERERAHRLALARRLAEAGEDARGIKEQIGPIGRDTWRSIRNQLRAEGVQITGDNHG